MPKLQVQQSGVFNPAELAILDNAVTDAWNVLSHPTHSGTVTREDVARHVVSEAELGERDQATLARHAVASFSEM